MMTGERNRQNQQKPHFPLQILFHYWNSRSNAIPARLDQLLKKGINHVVSFVPWQAVESDISHQLTKFLTAAAERQFTVSLILTPEIGIPYPNSGLPKDLVGKSETSAVDTEGNPIWAGCAPNVFPLPTLLSPEFQKRYTAYLSRLDHLLGTLDRPDLPVLKHLHFLLTGSFWKYYRSPRLSVLGPFLEKCAETSSSASIAYRKWLETYYAQPEFEEWDEIYSTDSVPSDKNLHDRQSRHSRWKTRAMDEINLRTFLRLSEEQFRAKNRQLTKKLTHSGALTSDIELFTPESDPSLHYATIAELLTGNSGAFQHLSTLIDDAGSRACWVGPGQKAEPFIHWSSQGTFRGLTDPEKQFLILKSLLAVGSQNGAVLIHEEEWFSFSPAFRNRLEMFARSLHQREMRLKTQALYLSNHSWSKSGTLSNILWDDLAQSVGLEAKHIASPHAIIQDRESHLLFVDPSQVLTKDLVRRALAWMATPILPSASSGGANKSRVVVLPKTSLYTEAGLRELENALQLIEPVELDLGLPYQIYSFQEGKVILVEMPDEGRVAKAGGSSTPLWQKFLTAVLSLSEIEKHCRTTDPSLVVLPLEIRNGSRAAFVLNSGLRPTSTELVFSSEVKIADLAAVLTGVNDANAGTAVASHRFAIEIPPCGVMALSVQTHKFSNKGVDDGVGTKLEGVSRNIHHSGPEASRSFPAQI